MHMTTDKEVTITIKYLVNLSERSGRREEEAALPIGSTLNDVIRYLKEIRNIILPSPTILTILNGKGWDQYPDKLNTLVSEGDLILLVPPISGG